MPHRRRTVNPVPAAAFRLADDSWLPLLVDYSLLQAPVDAPAVASAEWSGGSGFTASSDAATTSAPSTATAPGSSSLTTVADGGRKDTWVRHAREGYYLQLSLAIRLTSQAFLAGAPAPPEFLLRYGATGDADGDVAVDPEAVSYRLWVSAYSNIYSCMARLDTSIEWCNASLLDRYTFFFLHGHLFLFFFLLLRHDMY
jgi:hypothetical protein